MVISRVAVATLCSTSDKVLNLKNISKCASFAVKEGATMLFLPENCGFIGEAASQTLEAAEELSLENDSSILCKGLSEIAREHSLWISAGGVHEAGAPPADQQKLTQWRDHDVRDNNNTSTPRVFNSHVIFNDQGQIVSKYRKRHLFDVSIPGEVNLRESRTVAPGDLGLVTCENTPIGTLGLSICYDMRFPEQYINLAKKGAQVLLAPSAFTVPTGRAHWHILLRARAIENQCFMIAAAQCGKHSPKRISYGHSLVVDPWGNILADGGGYRDDDDDDVDHPIETPSVITCDIDLELINKVRSKMPMELHRNNVCSTTETTIN